MRQIKESVIRQYGEAFKLKVVDEYENHGKSSLDLASHYGISKVTVMNWVRKYGQYDRRTKMVRVSMKSESDEIKELKEALAEAHLMNRYLEGLVSACSEHVGHDLKKTMAPRCRKSSR